MFHCYLTYRRFFYKTAEKNEYINGQFHVKAEDEKSIRQIGCALSGLLLQMGVDHDVNFTYSPDRRSEE